MLRYKILAVLLFISATVSAQELFVYTEPSSNMPAKSIGIRLSNWVIDETLTNRTDYRFVPEIMWGANKNLMIHLEGYSGNTTGTFTLEGAGVYIKYRFLSKDKVYKHFRMAAFVRASTNNTPVVQDEIATNGYNTGYQLGLIGTQLLHKTALSLTAYYERALNNLNNNEFPAMHANKGINYSLSAGRLILPKSYKGYKQTNMNIMVECLGQTLLENGKQYIDVAGSLQFIFNSQTRLDLGYKHEVYSDMQRMAPNGLLVRVEHLLFNVL